MAEAALLAARIGYREGEIALVGWLDAVRAYYEVESTYAELLADPFIRPPDGTGGPSRPLESPA